MPVYTVTLTDIEQKAMEYIAADVDFWIQNAVHDRARVAMEELVAANITQTLATGGTISGTKEEIVMNSDLPNAASRNVLQLS